MCSEITVKINFKSIREFRMFADWYDDNIGSPVPFSVTPRATDEPGAVEVEHPSELDAPPVATPAAVGAPELVAAPVAEPEHPSAAAPPKPEDFAAACKRWVADDKDARMPKFKAILASVGAASLSLVPADRYWDVLAEMGVTL